MVPTSPSDLPLPQVAPIAANLAVRDATATDWPFLRSLFAEGLNLVPAVVRRDVLLDARRMLRIVTLDGRPVGFYRLSLRTPQPLAWLDYMGVSQCVRRGGLGRWLMHAAMHEAQAMGCTRFGLAVLVDVLPAIRLYEALGFQRDGDVERGVEGLKQRYVLELPASAAPSVGVPPVRGRLERWMRRLAYGARFSWQDRR